MLRQFGYGSLLFPTAVAFENHGDFDGVLCFLLDMNLGDESGIEVRRRLKVAGDNVPVIYMTGSDSPLIRETALQSGCLAYLTKPFSAKSLIEPIERAFALCRPYLWLPLLAKVGRHVRVWHETDMA
jgi:FixJ family two-component response regulator